MHPDDAGEERGVATDRGGGAANRRGGGPAEEGKGPDEVGNGSRRGKRSFPCEGLSRGSPERPNHGSGRSSGAAALMEKGNRARVRVGGECGRGWLLRR